MCGAEVNVNTKILMTACCIVLCGIGLAFLFAPAEFLSRLGVRDSAPLVLLVQLCGALYLGFAMLDWMSRESTIGGIYNRPLAMGNFVHFFVGALALLEGAAQRPLPSSIWLVAGVYAAFAISFGYVIFAFTPSSTTRATVGEDAQP